LKCPNEQADMRQVQLSSTAGEVFVVDQCPKCGGIWFDRFELYRAKDGESQRLDSIDVDAFCSPAKMADSVRLCPRDNSELLQFNDRYFPSCIIVERCPKCDGFWLNRGEFTKFQDARRALKQPREIVIENGGLQDEIQGALDMHRSGVEDSPIIKAARFLSTPLDETALRPFESGPGRATAESVNMALSVLMTLLRLFIFR
jgi:Zn-finger nucleic acid-binding protein